MLLELEKHDKKETFDPEHIIGDKFDSDK